MALRVRMVITDQLRSAIACGFVRGQQGCGIDLETAPPVARDIFLRG